MTAKARVIVIIVVRIIVGSTTAAKARKERVPAPAARRRYSRCRCGWIGRQEVNEDGQDNGNDRGIHVVDAQSPQEA